RAYEGNAEPAADLYQRGIPGYSPAADYSLYYRSVSSKQAPQPNLCLSLLSVSIPKSVQPAYEKTFEPLTDSLEVRRIDDASQFGKAFGQSGCDLLVMGLKSNYLDGYEYQLIFSEPAANLTGYKG